MADIEISVGVVGADQVAGDISGASQAIQDLGATSKSAAQDINQAGTAATDAGAKAKTAGGGFMSFGQRVAGVVAGVGLLASALFQIDDAFTRVEKANNNAVKAQNKLDGAIATAEKALRKYNEAVAEGGHSQAELTALWDDYVRKANKIGPAMKGAELAQKAAAKASVELGQSLLSAGTQALGAVGTIASFAAGAKGAGKEADAATGGVGRLGKSLIALGAIGAAIGVAFFAIQNNIGGFRDALNSLGKAIGDAVPAARPFLEAIKAIGAAFGLAPDVGNWKQSLETAFKDIGKTLQPLQNQLNMTFDTIKKFTSALHTGNIGGAFDILVQSVQKTVDGIKAAINSVDWAGVWKGLTDAFNSTIDFIKNIKIEDIVLAANATINWIVENVWPAVQWLIQQVPIWFKNFQDAAVATFNWLVETIWPGIQWLQQQIPIWFRNLQQAAQATFDWLVANVWPSLQWLGSQIPIWFKNLQQAAQATFDWLVQNVWPSLQWLGSQIPIWFKQLHEAAQATFNWLVQNVWPTIQAVIASIPQHLKNFVEAAQATWNWIVGHVWPPLQQVIASIPGHLKNFQEAAQATWNWIVGHVWPPLQQVLASIPGHLKNLIIETSKLVINWLAEYDWPTAQEVIAAIPPAIKRIQMDAGLALRATIESIVVPNLDQAMASLLGQVTQAIKNLPGAAAAITKAIHEWFAGLTVKPDQVAVDLSSTKPVVAGGGSILDAVVKWFRDNMPHTIKAIDTLTVTIGNLDWSPLNTQINRMSRDLAATFWNSLRDALTAQGNVFGDALDKVLPPKIKTTAELDKEKAQKDADDYSKKLNSINPYVPSVAKFDHLQASGAVLSYVASLNNIPAEVVTKVTFNTTGQPTVQPATYQQPSGGGYQFVSDQSARAKELQDIAKQGQQGVTPAAPAVPQPVPSVGGKMLAPYLPQIRTLPADLGPPGGAIVTRPGPAPQQQAAPAAAAPAAAAPAAGAPTKIPAPDASQFFAALNQLQQAATRAQGQINLALSQFFVGPIKTDNFGNSLNTMLQVTTRTQGQINLALANFAAGNIKADAFYQELINMLNVTTRSQGQINLALANFNAGKINADNFYQELINMLNVTTRSQGQINLALASFNAGKINADNFYQELINMLNVTTRSQGQINLALASFNAGKINADNFYQELINMLNVTTRSQGQINLALASFNAGKINADNFYQELINMLNVTTRSQGQINLALASFNAGKINADNFYQELINMLNVTTRSQGQINLALTSFIAGGINSQRFNTDLNTMQQTATRAQGQINLALNTFIAGGIQSNRFDQNLQQLQQAATRAQGQINLALNSFIAGGINDNRFSSDLQALQQAATRAQGQINLALNNFIAGGINENRFNSDLLAMQNTATRAQGQINLALNTIIAGGVKATTFTQDLNAMVAAAGTAARNINTQLASIGSGGTVTLRVVTQYSTTGTPFVEPRSSYVIHVTVNYTATGAVPKLTAAGFGPAVVDQPTLMMVGEAGPEKVSVTPLGGSRHHTAGIANAKGIVPLAGGTQGGNLKVYPTANEAYAAAGNAIAAVGGGTTLAIGNYQVAPGNAATTNGRGMVSEWKQAAKAIIDQYRTEGSAGGRRITQEEARMIAQELRTAFKEALAELKIEMDGRKVASVTRRYGQAGISGMT